jgi:hypothetical protein
MVSRIFRATSLSLPALAFVCVLSLNAHAQDDTTPPPAAKVKKAKKTKAAKKTDATEARSQMKTATPPAGLVRPDANGENETLKFNTDSAPVNTDRHPPMTFKDPGEAPLGSPRPEYADSVPDDAGYKAYIGYPKHQLGLYAAPTQVSSKWTGKSGEAYNLSNSAVAFGLNYKLIISPLWNVEADYQHYTLKMDPASLKVGATTFSFLDSKASFDNYFVRNRFCVIGKSTFYQQLCPGIDIGNDGYPIVNYSSNTSLAMDRVQDLIIGVNLTYQIPAGTALLFRVMGGYNYGTGIGNSGSLTSKNNSSYFADISLDFHIGEHNIIAVGADYKARTAKVSNANDSWETDASTFGGRLGYTRQF